ncbi:hypothetical protein ACP0HM_28975 [Escherichia coli]
MQRIGVTDYTILGTVKGAELELLRFTHPFMGFRRSGNPRRSRYPGCRYRCRSHRARPRPGRLCDRSEIRPETANPVGPDGTYLPGTYPTLDGVNVFKANDIVVALLQEKGALLHVENAAQLSRAAGVTKRRSSSARRRSGSSAWIRKVCVRSH